MAGVDQGHPDGGQARKRTGRGGQEAERHSEEVPTGWVQ